MQYKQYFGEAQTDVCPGDQMRDRRKRLGPWARGAYRVKYVMRAGEPLSRRRSPTAEVPVGCRDFTSHACIQYRTEPTLRTTASQETGWPWQAWAIDVGAAGLQQGEAEKGATTRLAVWGDGGDSRASELPANIAQCLSLPSTRERSK